MNFTSSLPPLPVDEVLPDLAAALRDGNRALLTAPAEEEPAEDEAPVEE